MFFNEIFPAAALKYAPAPTRGRGSCANPDLGGSWSDDAGALNWLEESSARRKRELLNVLVVMAWNAMAWRWIAGVCVHARRRTRVRNRLYERTRRPDPSA